MNLNFSRYTRLKEFLCIALVFLVSAGVYMGISLARRDPLEHTYFLQTNMLFPAVLFAAGLGMGTCDISQFPELEEFVYKKRTSFDIHTLPRDTVVEPLNTVWELTHLYYIYAVGLLWRLLGVSTWVVVLYAALLRAFSAVALYGLFRICLNRITSVLGILLLFTSPVMLHSGIDLRDFGKTPFILGCLFGIALLLYRRLSVMNLLLLAGSLGLLLGIGLGFRQDVLICIPPAVFTICVFAAFQSKHSWWICVAAVLTFCVFFSLSALPIFKGIFLEGGQAGMHGFLRGASPEIEQNLDFGRASYDTIISSDPAAYAQVNVYARRTGVSVSMENRKSSEYRRAHGELNTPVLFDPFIYFTGDVYGLYANKVFREMLLLYPADYVSRAWHAVFSTQKIPLQMYQDMLRSSEESPKWLNPLFAVHGAWARHLEHFGLWYILCVLAALSAIRFLKGLYVSLLFIWFSGYTTLWYEYRHFFHLAFISLLALLAVYSFLFYAVKTLLFNKDHRSTLKAFITEGRWAIYARNGFCYIVLMILIIFVPLFLLRLWQGYQVHKLADQLSNMPLESIPTQQENHDGTVHISSVDPLPGLKNAQELEPGETAWEYLAVSFNTHGTSIPLTIQYDDSRFIYSFTQEIEIEGINDRQDGKVTVFFPVYEVDMSYGGELMAQEILKTFPKVNALIDNERPLAEQNWWRRGRFLGISFPESSADDFLGLFRVRVSEELRLLPIFQLPEDHRHLRPYKTGPLDKVCLFHPGGDFVQRALVPTRFISFNLPCADTASDFLMAQSFGRP